MSAVDLAVLRAAAEAAGGELWHHVQAFQTVPAAHTVYGRVPAARVDYVSTWAGLGTPPGHRVVVPMPGRECSVRSEDMAHIAAASPAVVLELLDRLERAEEALSRIGGLNDHPGCFNSDIDAVCEAWRRLLGAPAP